MVAENIVYRMGEYLSTIKSGIVLQFFRSTKNICLVLVVVFVHVVVVDIYFLRGEGAERLSQFILQQSVAITGRRQLGKGRLGWLRLAAIVAPMAVVVRLLGTKVKFTMQLARVEILDKFLQLPRCPTNDKSWLD